MVSVSKGCTSLLQVQNNVHRNENAEKSFYHGRHFPVIARNMFTKPTKLRPSPPYTGIRVLLLSPRIPPNQSVVAACYSNGDSRCDIPSEVRTLRFERAAHGARLPGKRNHVTRVTGPETVYVSGEGEVWRKTRFD